MKHWQEQLPIEDITVIKPVAGGDINQAFVVETTDEIYFLLLQPGAKASFYDAEIEGLRLFEMHGITAPIVIDSGELSGDAYLLLSYLDEHHSGDQRALGRLVAKMHQVTEEQKRFGFNYPTDMGDLQFSNQWTDSWYDQFVVGRLDYLYQRIKELGYFSPSEQQLADETYQFIADTLKQHDSEPALLHGDLWAGNKMFLEDGSPALFDPAPFYGDREFDLGATITFGGFNQEFYQGYEEIFSLDNEAWQRIEFYKLYLLLVHLVKFGPSYKSSVIRSMQTIMN